MSEFKSKCLCGAAANVRGSRALVDGFVDVWRGLHEGDGHGETDSRTAYRARIKTERSGSTVRAQQHFVARKSEERRK